MSLDIAIKIKKGIIIASDSRGTFGDPRSVTGANDNIQKIHGLTKYTAIAMAGANEIGATLLDALKPQLIEDKTEGIDAVLASAHQLFRDKYNALFPSLPAMPLPQAPTLQRPGLAVILAGYRLDNEGDPKEAMLYTMTSQLEFAPSLSNYGFAIIGIPQYAIYLLNRLYSEKLSLESAADLASYCISETATQDGKVGGPIQVLEISLENGFREYKREEIEATTIINEKRSESLRRLFFKKQ